jgi:hypothetical protein
MTLDFSLDDAKKKRGRRKKDMDTGDILSTADENVAVQVEEPSANDAANKKRGRKPKGGKLISKTSETADKAPVVSNVILHLKCSLKDLNEYNVQLNKQIKNPMDYDPEVPPSIMSYTNNSAAFSLYETNSKRPESDAHAYLDVIAKSCDQQPQMCSECSAKITEGPMYDYEDESVNVKDINAKLKKLKMNLYKNTMNDKKSACFWCTCEYDNQPCYIPKYEMDNELCGYGSFCRPECAVAYLMKENLDDSTKFERYHLLNKIYSKIYDFKKNIKPAPNPYYLLDKFYGNLTIQEYRKLLKTEHMLLIIDKPLTRILPELHEDTDDFIMNIYGSTKGSATQAGGVYKVKRQSEKQQGPTKTSIMRDKFGLVAQ